MLNQLETELLKYVAYDPFEVPRLLISPEVGMEMSWLQTPLAIRVFSSIAKDALADKPTSLISISQQAKVSSEELKYLTSVWTSGKSIDQVDLQSVTGAMKNDAMARESKLAWEEYLARVKRNPELVLEYLHDLGARLSTIANGGSLYNPDPTTHYDDLDIEIGTSWRCHTMDNLLGGVPNMGYQLFIAPTGYGKSSYSRSTVVYSVIRSVYGEDTPVLIAVNELMAGVTSRGIRDALRDMWASERSEDDVDRDIRRYVKLYERCYSYSRFEQMLHWHRPKVAIIDSLDALGFPEGTDKMKEADRHQARAIGLAEMSAKYETFIVVPANASGENQIALKQGRMDKIYQAHAFGSTWYEAKSAFATVMTWDTVNKGISLFKNTKNRPTGQSGVGHVFPMAHSDRGHYYRDSVTFDLNP